MACVLSPGISLADSTASHTGLEMTVSVDGTDYTYTYSELAELSQDVVEPEGSTTLAILRTGSITIPSTLQLSWQELKYDPDPYINFVGAFSNLTGSAQDFSFSISTAVSPLSASLIGGSTVITLADGEEDGSAEIKNTAGKPGYSASLDGVPALDLLDPFSAQVTFLGQVAVATDQAGLPGPTIPAGAVNVNIGIEHRFNLTGRDSATFNSTFLVAVPEPGSALLLGFGALSLALVRRKSL